MLHPTNAWPTTKAAQGTKFFAQSMRTFLDRESFEGFRAYSLDTIGRLKEAITLLQDILAKRVRESALAPVLNELIWSIENDDAAKQSQRHTAIYSSQCVRKSLIRKRNLFTVAKY